MATKNKAAHCFPFASFHSRVPAYCDEFKLLHTFGRIDNRNGEKRQDTNAKIKRKKAKCQCSWKTKGINEWR